MSIHIFGAIVTGTGCAANNRGETEGNITTLQKLLWQGQVHTTVSAEAIRWALRYYWQKNGKSNDINRIWNDDLNDFHWSDSSYMAWHPQTPTGETCWDDDLLGFMNAAGGSEEGEQQNEIPRQRAALEKELAKKPDDKKAQKKLDDFEKNIQALAEIRQKRNQAEEDGDDALIKDCDKKIASLRNKAGLKSLAVVRRGILEVTRAISTTPFVGDITFNARSGEKGSTSLYGTEMHATRYQYGFAITPERLRIQNRCLDALDAISCLGEVAGNHSRFLFDFSPESIVLRLTNDPAPRILYCFDDKDQTISLSQKLVQKIESGDILPKELFVGGLIANCPTISHLKDQFSFCDLGVKKAVHACQTAIQNQLENVNE